MGHSHLLSKKLHSLLSSDQTHYSNKRPLLGKPTGRSPFGARLTLSDRFYRRGLLDVPPLVGNALVCKNFTRCMQRRRPPGPIILTTVQIFQSWKRERRMVTRSCSASVMAPARASKWLAPSAVIVVQHLAAIL
jgi:hypothetical protein